MPALGKLIHLLAFSLLLALAFPGLASAPVSKDDLDTQKELLQLKIDSGKELIQKDIDALGKRIEAIDKRVDDQVNRNSDLGFFSGVLGTLITLLLAVGGLIGYFSAAKKAREEAQAVAEKTSKKWFDDKYQELDVQIGKLKSAVEEAHSKIDCSIDDVHAHKNAAIEQIQKNLNAQNGPNGSISPDDDEGLRQSAEQIKAKPEANYSFEDWNTRAFAAYRSEQFEDAAQFWKHAAGVPNAGAEKTAQALFNRGVMLHQLKRHDEEIAAYSTLIKCYANDDTPALREQVAKAMNNKGVALVKLQKHDEAVATSNTLIERYIDDDTPAIREQVARAMSNKGVALGNMQKHDVALATFNMLIESYADDDTSAIREQVATAMGNKGIALRCTQKHDDAFTTYNTLIERYADDDIPAIREQVTKAMNNKGAALGKMQKQDEAIATYDALIERYANDDFPAIREQVAHALNGRGFCHLLVTKRDRTKSNDEHFEKCLAQAEVDLSDALARKTQSGTALGNLAYVQWLRGQSAEAELSFRAALTSNVDGGEYLYKATLDDIAQYSLPEDTGFRELVERLSADYQSTQAPQET